MNQKPVTCWCPVCNESHYLYKECGHWFVYNCPHFLSYHHLQNHMDRLKKWATTGSKGRKSKLAQYPVTAKKRLDPELAKPRPRKKGVKVVTHKKPKTHWHVDIEDISTGEL